jgi:adenylate cyclase
MHKRGATLLAWGSVARSSSSSIRELIAPLRVARMQLPLSRILMIAAAIHLGQVALFTWLGVWEMAAYNVLSVAAFAGAYALLRRGGFGAASLIGTLEVLIHQALAVHFVGWGAGFQYYLLAAAPLELMLGVRSRASQAGFLVLALGLFVGLAIAYQQAAPPYALDPTFVRVYGLVNTILAFALPIAFSFYLRRAAEVAEAALEDQRQRSEALLHRVLPPSIVERLRESGGSLAEAVDEASILFADIVGFTRFAERTPPREVLAVLDAIFAAFDELVEARGLEKIKTLGDAYMVAAGAPTSREDHAEALADLALAMLEELQQHTDRVPGGLMMRIGIHSGPVVAGVIGRSKFAYDLWGDTVNTAARMESHGEPGRIQVSEATARRLGPALRVEERGLIEVKGKGLMRTFWVLGRR